VSPAPELSFVIPVFDGAATLRAVVAEIGASFVDLAIEIVLVDDGSADESARVCAELVEELPDRVVFVQLSRNFGEHNAVLAGLAHATGAYAVVLDDDGQNPPAEARRLYDEIRRTGLDVVYGRYRVKQHGLFRNLGSRFNDLVANRMLKKPRGLYLSSFKILDRFLIDQVVRYRGARPYLDGLILRSTRSIGQVTVEHRGGPPSSYTLRKLAALWLNMFVNFSVLPLRVASLLGLFISLVTAPLMVAILLDKLYLNPSLTVGIPTVLLTVVFFSGVQLLILGAIGEYLGRLFLDQGGAPQYLVRSVRRGEPARVERAR
jgi:undecaprenyl-phosphate 4-deoxy-4-formamido-L-arabinose transferase